MKKVGFILLSAFLLGCSSRGGNNLPQIRYGRDLCSECGMTIMDSRFVCIQILSEGEILKFDDIGCMTIYDKKYQPKLKESWVHDGINQTWIENTKAFYVFDGALITPMGSHLIAFSTDVKVKLYLLKNDAKQINFDQINSILESEIQLHKEGK